MGAGLWTAIGSAAGVLAVVLIAWQVRLQLLERRNPGQVHASTGQSSGHGAGGLPVAVPLGRLPTEVRGRDGLLAELRRSLTRWPQRRGETWVLAGMGGLGKSTVALAVAETARAKGWRVWWVTASDTASLTGGMLEVLRQLGAPEAVIQPVREGVPTAADRAWEYLSGPHLAGRRWLLIFDDADAPAALAAHRATSPADYAGWLRPDPSGMVIVTTRARDSRVWGPRVAFRELRPLDDAIAARVLADLAPGIADPGGEQARCLGRRLGGLPLALHLAGSYLASPFARWRSFADYCHVLDSIELPAALSDLDDPAAEARATIQRTWDLSLDALATDGVPQARSLLFLLSCYAPAAPIPAALLQPEPLAHLLARGRQHTADAASGLAAERERHLRDGLRSLAAVGLIDIADGDGRAGVRAITVHPVVTDANRCRLLATASADLPGIGEAAVQLLQAACNGLDRGRPADWPFWHRLVPHVAAVLEWLAAHLGADALSSLLDISDSAGDALWKSGNHADSDRLTRLSVTRAVRLGDDHHASLTARQALAATLAARGRYAEAEQLYRQVLTGQRRILGDEHPATLKTRQKLAWPIWEQGRYAEAEQLCRQVLSDRQRVLGADHPDTLLTRRDLAWVIGPQGRYAEAEQLSRQVLAKQTRVLREDHPDTLGTRQNLAWPIWEQGRYAEAEQLYRQVVADRERVLGTYHPDTLSSRHTLAWAALGLGRLADAERLYQQVLGDRRRVLGDDHPDTLLTRHDLAWVIGLQDRLAEAESLSRRVLADRERILGDNHPDILETRDRLALIIAEQGRCDEAEELCRQVLIDRQRILGDDNPDTLLTCHGLAWIIEMQGRYGDAEQLYRQVLAGCQRVLGNEHPDTVKTLGDLARMTALRSKSPG